MPDKPTLQSFRELLSQPWIGPTISLVVLCVAIASLWYNVSSYNRQGARWRAEDADRIQVQIHLQNELTNQGYRRGYVEAYTGREPMRLQKM
jgi:hypothetical protein